MSDENIPVVTIAFRKVARTSDFQYMKIGNPVLRIEVLGDRHNLTCVAKQLFQHYLEEMLDEGLDYHLWSFQLSGHEPYSCSGLDTSLPILSQDMCTVNLLRTFMNNNTNSSTPCRLKQGSDLLFKYDEGSPTHMMATIESITSLPNGKSVGDYPARKADPDEHLIGAKRKRIEETPVLTTTMDEAYPFLRRRLMDEHRVRLEIGRGSDTIPHNSCWARIWGGGPNPAYDRSLECPLPFDNMNEALFSFERAIEKQVSPGSPGCTQVQEFKNPKTGVVYRKDIDSCARFSVVAHVLPTAAPDSARGSELYQNLGRDCSVLRGADEDIPLRSWTRSCFNFSVDENWKSQAGASRFNFAAQFSKVNAWLTHPGKSSYWLILEHGVLSAVKGKHHPRVADNVVHKTLKHTSLQAMFAEMEEMLVLPKAWKVKK